MPPARLNSVDSLRAFAVVPVILFHLRPSWLPGGYLGVDVFFVISGYLIAGILLREIAQGSFGFADFYARRTRRILPSLLVMLAVVATTWFFLDPWAFGHLAKLVRATISLRANVEIGELVGDYWGGDAQTQPLLHTWSLAVEEQYYLVFPLLLWAAARFLPARSTLWVIGLGVLASFSWYLRCSVVEPNAAFYATTARAWELLLGAMLAAWAASPDEKHAPREKPADWVGWLSLLILVLAYATPWLGVGREWRPLVAVVGTVCFLWSAPRQEGAHAWLDRPVIVYVGLISYSLYLWHWPVAVFFRSFVEGSSHGALILISEVAVLFALGSAAYYLVERPCRHARRMTWYVAAFALVIYFGVRHVARSRETAFRNYFENAELPGDGVAGKRLSDGPI